MPETTENMSQWAFYSAGTIVPITEDEARRVFDSWEILSDDRGAAMFMIKQMWTEIDRLRAVVRDRDIGGVACLPPGLRTDPPPQDGSQFVAWAHDEHGRGFREMDPEPRWGIAQWAASYRGGPPYWLWAVPGRCTSVKILGWLPLPCLDRFGRYSKETLNASAQS